jgi:TolA-binding protein
MEKTGDYLGSERVSNRKKKVSPKDQTMENSQKANLGCGTLILIAIIVMIFGNAGNDELSQDVQQLRQQISGLNTSVQRLESRIEEQSKQLKAVRLLLKQER